MGEWVDEDVFDRREVGLNDLDNRGMIEYGRYGGVEIL